MKNGSALILLVPIWLLLLFAAFYNGYPLAGFYSAHYVTCSVHAGYGKGFVFSKGGHAFLVTRFAEMGILSAIMFTCYSVYCRAYG